MNQYEINNIINANIELVDEMRILKKENKDFQKRIEKAIEILKLCDSKCAKETIEILKGGDF